MMRISRYVFYCVIVLVSACSPRLSAPAGSGYAFHKLVWSDEFKADGAPDTANWDYEVGYIRNKELQYYTRRTENMKVKDGILHIIALNDSLQDGASIRPVTSASLITRGKKEWTYGRIEIRAKVPSALGTWPAIWMLGTNRSEVGWPRCGEIDIMEHVGYMPDTLHFNVHTAAYNHVKGTNKGVSIAAKPYNDFHIYAVEWHPDHIDWFYDGRKVFTFAKESDDEAVWPFDKPQYLILNLAIGGAWGGSRGIDLSKLPQEMLVDYVRVYK